MIRRSLLLTLSAFVFSAVSSLTVVAQHVDDHSSHGPLCGMQVMSQVDVDAALARTRVQSPALYQQMVSEGKKGPARIATVGARKTFWILDRTAGQFNPLEASLAFDGKLGRIWVDVKDSARLHPGTTSIRNLAKAIDTATSAKSRRPEVGILQNDIDVFGTPPTTFDPQGKTDFLIFDIPDDGILGYFFPYDQEVTTGSNQTNLLYIDSRSGFSSTASLYNTIGHEYQHLIHYAHNPQSELFYNEGCSEVAGLLSGYVDRYNSDYFNNTNVDLLSFPTSGAEGLTAYERAYTLMWFLYEQYGEAFLTQMVKSQANGMSRINDALSRMGLPTAQINWRLALRNFAVANYLQTNDSAQYSYRTRITQSASTKPKQVSTLSGPSLPATGAVKLQRYGTAYMTYNTPGILNIRPVGTREFAAMAMLYRGSQVEVRELSTGGFNLLPSDGVPYDKIVIAYVNLSGLTNDITLTLSSTVGVEDGIASTGGNGIMEIAPMPASRTEGAAVTIATAGRSSVTLELYDLQGRLLRSYLDREKLAPGDHRVSLDLVGLEAGTYFVRLLDGETLSVRPLVVNR